MPLWALGERRRAGSVSHNLAVYQSDSGQYVLLIQYRTQYPGEQGHDSAMVGEDSRWLAEELAHYDPSIMVQGFPLDPEYADRQRQVSELLDHVQSVEGGLASPPAGQIVIFDWHDIDDDVIERLESIAAAEGGAPQEVLARAIERQMLDEGEGGGNVTALSAGAYCFDCHARRPHVVFTSEVLGYSLCQSCFEARTAQGRAKENETLESGSAVTVPACEDLTLEERNVRHLPW